MNRFKKSDACRKYETDNTDKRFFASLTGLLGVPGRIAALSYKQFFGKICDRISSDYGGQQGFCWRRQFPADTRHSAAYRSGAR